LDVNGLNLKGKNAVFNLSEVQWNLEDYLLENSGFVGSQLDGNNLRFEANSSNVYLIYFSEGIIPKGVNCGGSKTATIGSIKREMMISQKAMTDFETEYKTNYNGLKNYLHLPSTVDFAVVSDGLINASREFAVSDVDILVRSVVFDVISTSGNVTKAEVEFSVW
jgi:hypothetical protein